jgi:hypothetical protein
MTDTLAHPNMVNHPNRGGGRFNRLASNPTKDQVRELLEKSGYTQAQFGALVFKGVRTVEDWLSGERRMPPDTWQLIQVKIKARELMKRGRIAPQAVKDLGLELPGEET